MVLMDSRYGVDVIERAQHIRLVVFDVDGVLTDGKLTYTDVGHEIKSFSVKDGQGIALLNAKGLQTAVITARTSPINAQRAAEVGIQHVFQNAKPKLAKLQALVEDLKLTPEAVAFVGDDLPDYECLRWVGLACCPADAVDDIKTVCHLVSAYGGGQGAVREVCDLLLKVQGLYPDLSPSNSNAAMASTAESV